MPDYPPDYDRLDDDPEQVPCPECEGQGYIYSPAELADRAHIEALLAAGNCSASFQIAARKELKEIEPTVDCQHCNCSGWIRNPELEGSSR